MIDPLAAVGAIGGLVGVVSLATTRWRGDGRAARNDHQACLEKLAEHIEKADKRSEGHDIAIEAMREQHESCREHLDVLRKEIVSIRKSISPPPTKYIGGK